MADVRRRFDRTRSGSRGMTQHGQRIRIRTCIKWIQPTVGCTAHAENPCPVGLLRRAEESRTIGSKKTTASSAGQSMQDRTSMAHSSPLQQKSISAFKTGSGEEESWQWWRWRWWRKRYESWSRTPVRKLQVWLDQAGNEGFKQALHRLHLMKWKPNG